MVINNNQISEYLILNEYQCSSLNLDDNIQMFDDRTTIKENSIFGFDNNYEIDDIQNYIDGASGKDSIDINDEISNLFFMFDKNQDE